MVADEYLSLKESIWSGREDWVDEEVLLREIIVGCQGIQSKKMTTLSLSKGRRPQRVHHSCSHHIVILGERSESADRVVQCRGVVGWVRRWYECTPNKRKMAKFTGAKGGA